MKTTSRQQEILDVALDLISKRGIQGLTMKNLSREIGISEPAIYRHFENKIEILLAILDIFRQSSRNIFESGLMAELTALQKIEYLFSRHFERFAQNPNLVSVVFSEEIFRGEQELISRISEIIEKNAAILVSIIHQGQKEKQIRSDVNARHLAIMVMGTLRLFVKSWQMAGFKADMVTEGNKLIESVLMVITAQNNN